MITIDKIDEYTISGIATTEISELDLAYHIRTVEGVEIRNVRIGYQSIVGGAKLWEWKCNWTSCRTTTAVEASCRKFAIKVLMAKTKGDKMREFLIELHKDVVLTFNYYENGVFYYNGYSNSGNEIEAGFTPSNLYATQMGVAILLGAGEVSYLKVDGDLF